MLPLLIIATILLTTIRHEGAHLLASWVSGVPVHEVRLLPGFDPELGFYFGYVARGAEGGWLIDAAPFIAAVAWFAFFASVYARTPRSSPMRLPLFLIGLVSPIADLAYNYQGGLWRMGTDVWDLFQALPPALVHGFFILSILWMVIHTRRMSPITAQNVTRDRR